MKKRLLLYFFLLFSFLSGRAQSGYALLMEDGGSLSVCNNVVVNNGAGQSNVTAMYNLFGHYPLFAHSYSDFHIVQPELVFNLGDNSCATWLYDMMGMFRKYNDTVDLGAFEYPHLVNFTVFQDYEGTLNICNNIIINNYSGENLNVTNTGTNYLTDGSDVFLNDYYGFRPKLESAVVNAGDNSCAATIAEDLTGDVRVQHETVDIGAFECHYGDVYFPVWQESSGTLSFCNNIIINNHADTNVNATLSQYNYVTNSELVFLHDYSNFNTQRNSVTVNAGDNSCATSMTEDLNGDERVSNHTVDMGAFELRWDRFYFPVYQENGGNLHICNNIIMNNHLDTNVNVAVEGNNFVTNGADIFMQTYINFRPKRQIPTLDAGDNSCAVGIDYDLADEERVLNGIVDIGAYEYRAPEVNYPFYKEGNGDMHICNNIIIYNYADSNINVTVEATNLVTDEPDVFVFEHSLFMLSDSSIAIDAGSNTCAEGITSDLCGNERIVNEVVDKGAYERFFWPRAFGVYQEEEGTLTFCNNIFINNHSADSNVNVPPVDYNLVKDNDYVFADKYRNFKLLNGSVAVDAGFNTCCSSWENDLTDTTRVMHEVVDLGAFELVVDVQRAIVFQDSGSTLTLCNNVIILNSPYAPNVNFTPVPSSNIVNDLVEVFRDERYDFRLLQHSDAVDAGDNTCNGLPTDLDTVQRISNGTIDIGAFEIPYEYNYAGGGGGGGGGGGSGGGGGWGGGGYMVPDHNAHVYERNSATLYLCNNIIINNPFAANTNTEYGLDTVYCNLIKDTNRVFRDPLYDFRLIEVSIAVNHGRNDCTEDLVTKDIAKKPRILQDTIDIGAFEFVPFPRYVAVHQQDDYQMEVCNNIIINNREVFSVNDLNTPGNNILIDNDQVFRNNEQNFMPRETSAAINRGENSCNELATDIRDGVRIYADTIDIGAFEISHFSDSDLYVIWQKDGYTLNLCNNIIINNNGVNPVSDMTVSSYNLLVDHDDVFKDNETDYTPRENSIVINVGSNICCPLTLDIADEGRIFEDTIDLGAYEQGVSLLDTAFVVLQKPGHELIICNNIIVNNSITIVTNVPVVDDHNLFTDDGGLFVDASFNYTPRPNSAAVNAGNNGCCQLTADICEKIRIYEEIIDIGAIEPSLIYDTTIALNGIDDEGVAADLTLCNNIIINNKYSKNLNILNVPANNIVTDNDTLFVDKLYNYRLRPNSIAINHGNNDCVSWGADEEDNIRIHEEIVDIGAYEQYVDNPIFTAVLSNDTDALVLCNNIIINNTYTQNVNLDNVPDNNIVVDDASLFIDPNFNYMPRSGSAAVDHGSNECADWAKDISTKGRVFAEIIDIGAYEVTVETVIDLYAVNGTDDGTGDGGSGSGGSGSGGSGGSGSGGSGSGSGGGGDDPGTGGGGDDPGTGGDDPGTGGGGDDPGTGGGGDNPGTGGGGDDPGTGGGGDDPGTGGGDDPGTGGGDDPGSGSGGGSGSDSTANAMKLKLYNNIVINNAGHAMNVGGNVMGDHNLLNDIPNVFENEVGDYSLQQNSPAIDAGDNQWVSWPLDLKDDPRIACANIVDQGAFEYYFGDVTISLTSNEVATDNCQGYYIELTATAGAQHYYWSHSNEDTNTVQVSPLIPTLYTVIASNGGECVDTASLYVVPSALLADSLGAPASVGKTFWLSYLVNHFRTPTLTLNVSAEEACEGTVSNPRTGWSTSFTVGAHSVTTVTIPVEQAYPGVSSRTAEIGDYGLLVETTDSVSLYAANYNVSSFDVTDVLPIDALSDEYVLQTYTPMMNAEFVVVATQDNTVIDITPTRALQGNHQANHTFSVTLQAGQTYLGLSQYGGALGDLSGTVVKSRDNKPIAVFNGNVCALVPTDNSYTDHLVEQAIGIKYWGKSFAITSTESQNFDVLRVTALHGNTEVRKNGTLLTTLSAYQTYEFQLAGSEGSCYLETSKPAGVYLYIAGAMHGNPQERSDPSMIWIPPTEQKLSEITFATFNSPGISDHYVNIVIPASSIAEVMLDGMAIGGQFTLLNGSSDYAFVRKHIANGTHTLQCEGGFIAHCYGLGFHESYGYAAGSRAVPLKEQLFVNGILTTDLPADTKFCPYEPINFSTLVNYPCDSVVWNFGDNTPTVNATSADHAYPEAGTYTVTATLYITSNGTVFCSNLYARIKVVDGPTIFYYDTICRGAVYADHGFEVMAEENGHFSYTRTVEIAGQYCDSTFVLELEVLDNYLVIEDTVCFPHTYTEYGFHFVPESTGYYCDTLNAGVGSNGCDSLVILHLSVTPNTDNPPAIEGEGSPCLGDIYAYSIDSLSGLQNVVWTVPDSVIVMPQQDPYHLELMFDRELDSLEICISAQGGCGELNWCRVVYPQPYNQVYLYDTLCANVTEYDRYGFTLTGVSDTNDLFTHHDVASGGCDSVTILSLFFLPVYEVEDSATICINDFPYQYHDTLLAKVGTHRINLYTESGCDSIVYLTLNSNPISHSSFDTAVCNKMVWFGETYTESGSYDTVLTNIYGCDSTVTMNLTVYVSDTVAVDSAVCRAQLPVVWNGLSFLDAGVQTAYLQNGHGCDSLVVMTLNVKEATADTLTVTVLERNLPYSLNRSEYHTAGTYTQNLTNAVGCDSTLTIILNVLNTVENSVDSTICSDMLPFEWNGVIFTQTDTLVASLHASNGADSLVVMNVTVMEVTYADVYDTACESMTWIDGITYYESTDAATFTLINAAGCDSIVTLHLLVNHATHFAYDVDTCDWYRWNDSTYTESGTYTYSFADANGCTQVDTLHLTINNPVHTAVTVDTCDWYRWNDSTYTATGSYTYSHPDANGCTQVDTLHLTINHATNMAYTVDTCDWYRWNDSTYTESGTYTYSFADGNACTQVDTLHLTIYHATHVAYTVDTCDWYTWNDSTYTTSGTYTYSFADANNCTQVDTLHLTINNPVHTAVTVDTCDWYRWNDSTYTENGTYTYSHPDDNGCTQVDTLHLTINHATNVAYEVDTCDWYRWNDSTYTESGTYTFSFADENGCTQVDTLHLTIYHASNVAYTVDTCDWYSWNDSTYTVSGTYTYSFADGHGCTQVDTLHLTIYHATHVAYTVDTCDWYTWNDSTYTESGTYTYSFADANNCTQVDTLHLTINHAVNNAFTVDTCDWYTWNGTTYDTSGTYTFSFADVNGCTQVDTLHLTINHATNLSYIVTAIDTFVWAEGDGETYDITGNYYYTHGDSNGCTQVDTLHLTIYYSSSNDFSAVECESYEWDGVTYTESGQYMRHYTDIHGADSTVTLHLTINNPVHTAVTVDTCDWYRWNDSTYTATGTYTYSHPDANGCTQVDTLHLTINHATNMAYTVDTCDWYRWNDSTYTESGTYTYSFADGNACTQVDTLHLTIYHATHVAYTVDTCDWYTWNDSTYTTSGTYTYSFADANNCTQVDTLHLTINNPVHTAVTVDTCDWYRWNDSTYTENGTYTYSHPDDNGCTQVDTLHLTINHATNVAYEVDTCDWYRWNDSTYTESGTYTFSFADENGCTQVDTLHLTIYHASNVAYTVDTCDWYSWNDSTYTVSGTYTYSFADGHGCTQVDTLHLTIYHATHVAYTVDTCDWYTWNDSTYTATGTYTYSFADANNCTQVDTLHLTINHAVNNAFTVDTCDWYTWNGTTYDTSGTYTFSFADVNGCTQVDTLHLTLHYSADTVLYATVLENNLPYHLNDSAYQEDGTYMQYLQTRAGCDSTITLHLTVLNNVGTHLDSTICADALPFTWNDSVFTVAGTKLMYLVAASGADSIVAMTLTVNALSYTTLYATVVENELPYQYLDSSYFASGEYTYILTNALGCDSVVTLDLTVYGNVANEVDSVICESELPLIWNDSVFTASASQVAVLTAASGADSVLTMNVTVIPTTYYTDTLTACDSLTWIDGITYYESNNSAIHVLTNAAGCDSVVTLCLTVNHTTFGIDTLTTCDSLTWIDGVTYRKSTDTVTYILSNAVGCDSVVTLHLTVNRTTHYTDMLTACDSLTWIDGITYYESNSSAIHVLTNATGCDSVVKLNLTMNHTVYSVDTLTACDSLTWIDGITYYESNYSAVHVLTTVAGCDSVVTLHLTVNHSADTVLYATVLENNLPYHLNDSAYQEEGFYMQYRSTAMGCDSTITLHLTVLYNVGTQLDSTICADVLPLTWNDSVFTAAGTKLMYLEAASGADSIVAMTLTVNALTDTTLYASVIENELPYQYLDSSYYASGEYTYILTNAAGCDSVVTIDLMVYGNVANEVDSVICENELPLIWNDSVFTASGSQVAVLTAASGADSVLTMNVTVIPTTYGTLDTTVVENTLSVTINDSVYREEGTYTQHLTNAAACDSILTIHLHVLYNVTVPADSTVCESELPLVWNGVTFDYASSEPLSGALTLVDSTTVLASTGVDSTIVMTVTVNPTTYGTMDITVLEDVFPFNYNGEDFAAAGVYTQNFPAMNHDGCDSVLTLYLHTKLYRDSVLCQTEMPLDWNGVHFELPGSATFNAPISLVDSVILTATTGVDSIVVMTVTVNPTTYGTIDTTLIENDLPLVLNGVEYGHEGGFEQILQNANVYSCDSVLTINFTVLYNVTVHEDSVLCQTELPLTWNGVVFELDDETALNAPVTLVDSAILTASTGVDSTVVMSVSIYPVTYEIMTVAIIENDLPFVLNGVEYDTTAVYEQILPNANAYGCDSVITLNLTVLYNVSVSVDSTVCESELPLTWNGVVFELHEVPASATMVMLMDSAVLTASTGVDSTVMMTLQVIPTTYATLDTVVLENDLPLLLNGSSYMTPDTYAQTLNNANANGCDSVLMVNMTVLYNVSVEVDSTVCETELPLTWNGVTFAIQDVDVETHLAVDSAVLPASTGVDSTVVMTVYVIPTTYANVDTIVLENNLPLHYNDSLYRESGVYTQYLVNNAGCDSVLTLNMTVLYNVTVEVDSIICDGELPFTWNGVTFAAEDIDSVTSSAMDSVVLTASTGVDSTVMMTVHVHYANTGIDVQTACDSYTWIDGVTYTASTETATYTLTNAAGCDSVVTLHLTVNYSVVSQDTLVLVENQLPYYITAADTTISNGAPAEFQFNYHLSTIHGCDSTIAQTVIIHYNTSETVDTTVCVASMPYTWHNHIYTAAGSYTDTLLNANGSNHYVTWQLAVSNPVVTVQNTQQVTCYGGADGSASVNVTGGVQPYNYVWENNTGTTVSTTVQLSNQPVGVYVLQVVDAIGCVVLDSVSLQHQNDSMVAGVIASDRLVCQGSAVSGFTGTTATGGASSAYQWQISTNGTDWTAAPTPNNAQNYTYPNTVTSSFSLRRAWVSQACGTVYSNVVTVSVAPVYNDTLHENVCQGYAYQEYGFEVTEEETEIPAVITRTLHLQSVNSCDSTVTLVLTVIPSTHTTVTDESCQRAPYQANGFDLAAEELGAVGVHTFERVYTTNGCDSIVTLQLTIHPVYEIEFEDVVCEGSAYNLHGFDVTTVQTLGVSDVDMTQHLQSQNGCDSTVTLHLTVVDTSVAIVSLTADFCEEYSAELSVETNMTDYLWNTGETSQTITVNHPGTYMVTATQDNCSVTSWYTIDNCELNIYLPNAITPGLGDGLNDYFCLHEKYLPMIEDFEIRIYTRWGELIYYSDDKNFKWNGEYKGRINRQIIYTYLINFTDSRGIPYQITGSITVL